MKNLANRNKIHQPPKIIVCHCEQCRFAKRDTGKNYKHRIKRIMNKKRRQEQHERVEKFYWI
jgi:hypothetical protein